ncbi:LCP family protein [Lacticaseibacillus parakribbianus]|uniref:LCP family protein n=1 Tax=Lacticaseibacillus parakribbianus TaxID=2970927 RepID=UPI0021CAE3BF|nr:LCP family protein [Lacticaseibacillus parakribbianus]
MDTRTSRHDQGRPHRPWLKFVLLIVSTLLVTAGLYGLRLYSQAKYAFDKTYASLDNKANPTIQNKKPFAALLIGVDSGALGRTDNGRSDTLIVAVVNPKQKKTTLVSVPRDTAAKMIGTTHFNMQKINAAYSIGSSKMAVATVSALVNVPIDYYLTVNMGALEKIVDAVGGIDVQVPFSFTDKDTGSQHFVKGPMHLNGAWALAYARMRHEDPEGDYGRQKRQQQVIRAILKKALSTDTLTHFDRLLKTISGNMRTNLSFSDLTTLVTNYRAAAGKVTTDHVQGHDAWVYPGPSSYQIPSTSELQRVSDKLRTALGLATETIANQNVRENKANTGFNFDNPAAQVYTIYNPEL